MDNPRRVLANELENILRDLATVGTLVKDRGYRQIWRFDAGGRGYFLKFYPKEGFRDFCRRLMRGSPARREFERLQWLQKAKIPAPRAVALLMGFKLQGRVGDAVVLEAIEPSVTLYDHLMQFDLSGEAIPNRVELARQVVSLIHQLGAARLGHVDLHLGNFLLSNGKLFLIDGYSVRPGGLKTDHVMKLAHSCRRFATTTDLLRGWRELGPDAQFPQRNSASPKIWRSFIKTIWQNNRYFGKLGYQEWTGVFFRRQSYPVRWSPASRLQVDDEDWNRELPRLMTMLQADQFQIRKRSPSGDVLEGEITINHRPVNVIIKRPRKRKLIRYVNQIGRGTRAHREWKKSWCAIVRGWPVAWPMLLLERRVMGYLVDAIIVYEKVPGKTLEKLDLSTLSPDVRQCLMRRTGRLLRKIEQLGWSHFDAKASNWMAYDDPRDGLTPVMIDIDGIRHRRWRELGIRRLIASMKRNPHFDRADEKALWEGYAPWTNAPSIEQVLD